MRSQASSSRIPHEATTALAQIGAGIRAARLRRRRSAKDLADRMEVSLPTLRKLERGDPGVSMGVFLTALWVMGMLDPVRDAVLPEHDRLAAALETTRLPKRVRRANRPKEVDLDSL